MNRARLAILSLVALAACGRTPPAAPSAVDGWLRLAPPGANASAGYLRLRNPTAQTLRCDRVVSTDFGAAELHRSVIEDGRSRMLRDQVIEVPPHGEAELAPGGYHLMLFRPQRDLAEGDTVQVTLHCGERTVDAVLGVRKA
ncbi:copper chaperone PCu(A)C [Sinimarinibacterium thermocellulolyticum]|uniref:Copper chaperone PCu(A)C n=1 Tax=Sinimarinibacterium thermocellulolyticum TaxID=3170016 RepID=A0ABV2AB43_9GAMM